MISIMLCLGAVVVMVLGTLQFNSSRCNTL